MLVLLSLPRLRISSWDKIILDGTIVMLFIGFILWLHIVSVSQLLASCLEPSVNLGFLLFVCFVCVLTLKIFTCKPSKRPRCKSEALQVSNF